MKKIFRKTLSLLLAAMVLFSFSGCAAGERLSLIFGHQKEVKTQSLDKYAYNCLSEDEKKLYDIMYDAFMEFKSDIVINKVEPSVLEKLFYSVVSDHGGLFWVSGYNYSRVEGDASTKMLFSPDFTMTKEERDNKQKEVDAAIDKWLSGISKDSPDYQKSLYVYENLVSRVDYDENAPDNQNILSVFLNGKSVCQGYANAAAVLFDRLNIKNVVLRGTASKSPHSWNLIMLDGGWYFFDATWGNSRYLDKNAGEKTVNYAYLNVTSEEMASTHVLDMEFPVPECTAVEDNYYRKSGLYFDTVDKDAIGKIFADAYTSGKTQCSVKFSTITNYLSAVDHFVKKGNIGLYCKGLSYIYYNERRDMLVLTVYFW